MVGVGHCWRTCAPHTLLGEFWEALSTIIHFQATFYAPTSKFNRFVASIIHYIHYIWIQYAKNAQYLEYSIFFLFFSGFHSSLPVRFNSTDQEIGLLSVQQAKKKYCFQWRLKMNLLVFPPWHSGRGKKLLGESAQPLIKIILYAWMRTTTCGLTTPVLALNKLKLPSLVPTLCKHYCSFK